MADKNRIETKTTIGTTFVPTLQIADHSTFLNEMADNLKFRKDSKSVQNETSGNITVTFENVDLVDLTITGNVSITLTNLVDGDVKYLKITKSAFNTIEFSGGTFRNVSSPYGLTEVIYEIKVKDNVTFVQDIPVRIIKKGTESSEFSLQNNWAGFIYAYNFFNIFTFFHIQVANSSSSFVAGNNSQIATYSDLNLTPTFSDAPGNPSTIVSCWNNSQNKFQGVVKYSGNDIEIEFANGYTSPETITASGFILTARA